MSHFFKIIQLVAHLFGVLIVNAPGYGSPSHQLQTCLTVEHNGHEVPLTEVGKRPPPKSVYHLYATVHPADQVLVVAFDKKGHLLTEVPPQILLVRDQSEEIRLDLNAREERHRVRLFVVAFPAESSQANEIIKLLRSQSNPKSTVLYNRLAQWYVEEDISAKSSMGSTENVAGGIVVPRFAWRKSALKFQYSASQPRTVIFEIKQ